MSDSAANFTGSSGLIQLTAAGAGTTVSKNQDNPNHRGLKVMANITSVTGSLTVTVQGVDAYGNAYAMLSSTALAAPGATMLTIYPGITPAANLAASDFLPPTWNLKAVVAGGPCTATLTVAKLI